MKLIIFGATGTVGAHLVEQALFQGHEVTAFARKPSALEVKHKNLTRQSGDVFDPEAISQAIQGHDAVLIALGSGRKGTVRSIGTQHVIDAMQRRGIRRLVCLSTLGAGDSYPLLNFFWRRIMFGFFLKQAYADHQAQETLIRKSHLDWTIVRPGAFTDGPATNNYQHGFPATSKNIKTKVSRVDVANFMLRQLTDESYLHQSPALSY